MFMCCVYYGCLYGHRGACWALVTERRGLKIEVINVADEIKGDNKYTASLLVIMTVAKHDWLISGFVQYDHEHGCALLTGTQYRGEVQYHLHTVYTYPFPFPTFCYVRALFKNVLNINFY